MNVAILGSCVTRDIFDFANCNDWVKCYFSRSSIVSIMSPPILTDEAYIKLDSSYQRRAVYYDLNKTFLAHSDKNFEECDFLIIDFIDERFVIGEISGVASSRYLTESAEFVKSGLSNILVYKRLSLDEKNKSWYVNIPKFFGVIEPLVRNKRVILHEAYFTQRYLQEGVEVPFKQLQFINVMNKMLHGYYEALKELCGDSIYLINFLGAKNHVADPTHKWGLDPSHFSRSYYEDAFECILKVEGGV